MFRSLLAAPYVSPPFLVFETRHEKYAGKSSSTRHSVAQQQIWGNGKKKKQKQASKHGGGDGRFRILGIILYLLSRYDPARMLLAGPLPEKKTVLNQINSPIREYD
jgi:hypothetical protein